METARTQRSLSCRCGVTQPQHRESMPTTQAYCQPLAIKITRLS